MEPYSAAESGLSSKFVIAVLYPDATCKDLIRVLFRRKLHCINIISSTRLVEVDRQATLRATVPELDTVPMLVVRNEDDYYIAGSVAEAYRLLVRDSGMKH